ncbi:MAG: HD domain-containing protein [Candidatus Doudnabacteria bacterium]|nr:HD domain-containing protein [Candidatus Doudnabacteria bacterium]
MNTPQNPGQILNALIKLHKDYALVHRRAISYDKYKILDITSVDQTRILESLLEHVGSLPVVATFLYPYLEQKEKVDLGRTLTMLAIHDIGEIIVGDAHSHRKT